jgi:DNA-binding MarR family transcriptional regulator
MGMKSEGNLMSDIMDEMDPRMLEFIRQHVTTFTRWDTLRFFHENPYTQDTAENLARYVGRSPSVIKQEAQEMSEEGLFRAVERGEHTVYLLTEDTDTRQLIASLVKAARDRNFRMKLVYHILRAGGQS